MERLTPRRSQQDNSHRAKLVLSMVTTEAELIEVQRLRYKVFVDGLALTALQNCDKLDTDKFDEYCDHLIVRDSESLKIVGTYRILPPQQRQLLGTFYAEQEFDLSRLLVMSDYICEAGRACVHPDYRGSSVLMLLWTGLLDYLQKQGCRYLMGCASVNLMRGGYNVAALYAYFMQHQHLAPVEIQVSPRLAFPLTNTEKITAPSIPPLIRGYLKSGAWICGKPAWDPDFNTADFLILLDLSHMSARFGKRYLHQSSD